MVISSSFSLVIYRGATMEINRIQMTQRLRRPAPNEFMIDPEIIEDAKKRIAWSLFSLNAIILGISGVGGYFLAGKTLNPIEKMIEDQKSFVANASHELRTPLTSLKTSLEVSLRDKDMNLKEAKKVLASNLDDVNSMTRLSNYLLKLSHYQNGKGELKKVGFVDISKLVKDVAQKFTVDSKVAENIKVKGDFDSLSELITILVDNAIKYSKSREGVLVSLNKNKSKVNLIVSDKGQGISKEDLPHIFDRFYRGDKARSKDGFGLGLSIAKQIADSLNAKIVVESKLGKGSSFKVVFS